MRKCWRLFKTNYENLIYKYIYLKFKVFILLYTVCGNFKNLRINKNKI